MKRNSFDIYQKFGGINQSKNILNKLKLKNQVMWKMVTFLGR